MLIPLVAALIELLEIVPEAREIEIPPLIALFDIWKVPLADIPCETLLPVIMTMPWVEIPYPPSCASMLLFDIVA